MPSNTAPLFHFIPLTPSTISKPPATISRHHHRFFYIGCTHNTMQTCESNRNRKFRQVTKDAIVDAELSLRWWRQHHNYPFGSPRTDIYSALPTQTQPPAHCSTYEKSIPGHFTAKPATKYSKEQALHPFGPNFDTCHLLLDHSTNRGPSNAKLKFGIPFAISRPTPKDALTPPKNY